MENFVVLLIPVLLAVFLIRLLILPIRLVFKLVIHSGCGFLCLWILNTVSGCTGVYLPVNAITAAIAGFLGIPGIGLIALLDMATG